MFLSQEKWWGRGEGKEVLIEAGKEGRRRRGRVLRKRETKRKRKGSPPEELLTSS